MVAKAAVSDVGTAVRNRKLPTVEAIPWCMAGMIDPQTFP